MQVARHDDWRLALDLERSAGWPRDEVEVRLRFAVEPEGHFVAREGAEALGAASCVVHGELAWVGGMVVKEEHRRRGVGRALLRACLEHAAKRGASVVGLDATAEGEPLYRAEGFAPVARTERWRREGPPRMPAGEPREVAIYPVSACELMDLVAYDAPRFGGRRGKWLAAALDDLPEQGFVAFRRGDGALAGFVLGQRRAVGPLVADTEEAAAWLLRAAEAAGAPPVAHLGPGNPAAERVFRAAGYAPTGAACLRMVRGGALPGQPGRVHALASWAVG